LVEPGEVLHSDIVAYAGAEETTIKRYRTVVFDWRVRKVETGECESSREGKRQRQPHVNVEGPEDREENITLYRESIIQSL
jgi:hypothetical protein